MKLDIHTMQTLIEEAIPGTSILIPSKEIPQDILVIPILTDRKSRAVALHISILEAENTDIGETDSPISLVQFYVGFPFEVPQEKIGEMITLLNLLNQVSELTGFCIIQELPFPFFRHSLITKKGVIEEEVLLTLVGMIVAMMENYAPTIARLSDQERSLKEIIESF